MRGVIFLVCILIFGCQLVVAQVGSIQGTIISDGSAVSFASVGIKNTSLGTNSVIDGSFKLEKIPYGVHELIVSVVGYESYRQTIEINSPQPINITIALVEKPTALQEVVVTGTMKEVSKLDSPVPVEVYSPTFFRYNPTPSIFESLQNVNGVRPQVNCSVCNTGDIHMNGMEGPYTMVLIDGMPIVSGLSTVYGLTGIPQSLIDRVEIVKGPASTLYGSEAVGGLLNVITKNPLTSPRFSADVFGTGWGEVNADVGVKFDLSEKAHSLVGVNYFYYGNPIDNNGDNFTDVTLQNRVSIFNKWNFERKNNRVFNLAGRVVKEERWGGEMQWQEENRGGDEVYGESIYTDRWELFGVYQLPTSENINLQFSFNGHDQDSFYGTTRYVADQKIGFGQLTWNKLVGNSHDLLVGAAYRYTYFDDNTFATESSSITHLPGVFVQDEITLNQQNKLLLGMRYDYNSMHGDILTPRLNYKWNSKNQLNIVRLSVGNGYRVANIFTEDHAALTGAREVVFEGELLPEQSWNVNLNYVKKIYTANETYIGLDMSAFYTQFDNRIIPDYETDDDLIIYRNLDGAAVSQGISANLDMQLKNGLTFLTGATLMDVTVENDGVKQRQLLTENFSGVWGISYTFYKSMISVDYTGNVYGPMRLPLLENDTRSPYSPWYSIQNIQVTKKFLSGLEVYGGVKNLLNFTPAANSINGADDPFGPDFDPTYVYASNQGIRGFLGVRYSVF